MAKDALGNDVTVEGWTSTHLPGDRSLVQVSEFGLYLSCRNAALIVLQQVEATVALVSNIHGQITRRLADRMSSGLSMLPYHQPTGPQGRRHVPDREGGQDN